MTVKILHSQVFGQARSGRKFLTSDVSDKHEIDYKNIRFLSRFTSEQGKIIPRRISGTSAKMQRLITREIKRARILALLPFTRSTKFNTSLGMAHRSGKVGYRSRTFNVRKNEGQEK